MQTLHTIIIEDEFHSRESIKNLLNDFCDGIEIIGEASNAEESIFTLQAHKPDLVFMDIELGDGTAFDVLKTIKEPSFSIVFTTAYDHYAINAIKFNALDYLLKPIDIDDLQMAIEKVRKARQKNSGDQNLEMLIRNLQSNQKEEAIITLSTSESFEYVPVDRITRCEGQGAYTKFWFKDRSGILVSKTIKEYENLLSDHGFVRVHQSHLVNVKEIDRYVKSDGGYIMMKDGSKVAVSRGKKDDFFNAMQKLNS